MPKLRIRANESGLFCHAEDLLKMQILPLIGQIHVFLRVIILFTLNNSSEIGCGIERRAVGLDENAGRNLLCVRLLLHRHDQRTLGLHAEALGLDRLEHLRDVFLRVAFAEPYVEADAEIIIVAFEIFNGHAQNVLPERTFPPFTMLEAKRLLMRAGRKGFVLLAAGAGCRIDALKFRDCKRRFGWIFAGIVRVEVRKPRLFILKLRHDEPHLQAPVAQMDIADHMIAEKPVNTLE